MSAITRWISYNIDAVGIAADGDNDCKGTRGYSVGTASVSDKFNIGSTTDKLYINISGESAPYITLYSGSNLDPRFVARDITEKLHTISGKTSKKWANAICKWENAYSDVSGCYGNRFKIYSGDSGSSASVTVTASGVGEAGTVLGWGTKKETGGSAGTYTNFSSGTVSISGTYYGFFDEVYKVVVSTDNNANRGIGTPTKNITYDGTMTTGGVYNYATDDTYTIAIDVSAGTTMGAGTGNVPTMSWTSTNGDDSDTDTELLYPDHWYNVGIKGLMVKFTDAVFSTHATAWIIACHAPDYAYGTNASADVGQAEYVYSSDRGDMSSSTTTTVSGGYTALGTKGLNIKFNPGAAEQLTAGYEFYVLCSAPLPGNPSNYNISSLNYGNVTVSTESSVKCVIFEIESGAIEASSVKFGLQSHGTFQHHNAGNNDTKFRFGTVGPYNIKNGKEWWPNVVADDIDSDVPPAYLYATKENLSVVSTADDSEAIGNTGLVSDPIWMNIRLGSSESGNNSNVNLRLYFDFS